MGFICESNAMFNNLVREHCDLCKCFLKSLTINIYVVAINDEHSWGFCQHKYDSFKKTTPQKHRFQWWFFVLHMFYLGTGQPLTIFCQLQWSRASALSFWHRHKCITLEVHRESQNCVTSFERLDREVKIICCTNSWRYSTILGCCFGLTPPQLNKIFIPGNSCCCHFLEWRAHLSR